MEIEFDSQIKTALPGFKMVLVEANVVNSPTSGSLSALLDEVEREIAGTFELPAINKRPGVAATRAAYKTLGKDPNRYRPAAEQLCRRIVRGLGLYRVNTLVDLINILSVRSGYSIGGFDADRIDGATFTLGVGRDGEPYEGIGRGPLNIASLPVYRDATGGVGTPTSDNERTKLGLDTRRLVMTVNIYGEEMGVDEFKAMTADLLTRYCDATDITFKEYSV